MWGNAYVLDGVSGILVTQGIGTGVAKVVLEDEGVGVAHARCSDLEKDLVWTRSRPGDVLEFEVNVARVKDGCAHSRHINRTTGIIGELCKGLTLQMLGTRECGCGLGCSSSRRRRVDAFIRVLQLSSYDDTGFFVWRSEC